MHTITRNTLKLAVALLLIAALFGSGFNSSVAYAACASTGSISIDLWAKPGTATLYGTTSVNMWGYTTGPTGATDSPSLPGPVLTVDQGQDVTVNLTNNLPEDTAVNFQGQEMIPDTTGAAGSGGTHTYTFRACKPGTFIYEAGLIPGSQHQVAMGLYGALIVRPAGAPSQAYTDSSTAFDSENVVVLSEIDTTLNTLLPAPPNANPASFDMRKFAPKYLLINGKAYPGTASVPVTAGDTVLLRYVNAGLQSHAMSLLGLSQTVIATDGNAYTYSHKMASETIAPGQTLDTLIPAPVSVPIGSQFALYDANMLLRNSTGLAPNTGLGGMLTFLTVGAPSGGSGDPSGPLASGVLLSPNPANGLSDVTVTASIDDSTTGGSNIQAAEFYIDSTAGSPTAMTAVDLTFDSATESVTGTIPIATLAGLASGNHTIFVRGQDTGTNWGGFASAVLNLDKAGPLLSSLTLTPNPNTGVAMSLTFTANDTTTGSNNVTAAEYWVDAGAHTPITVGGPASPIKNLSDTIPAQTNGTHVVSVRAQDALGNWSATSTINLVVDNVGPTTSSLVLNPNPTNGSIGLASAQSGTATGGTLTSLVDSTRSWTTNQWVNFQVRITAGTGSGQSRRISANTGTSLTVTPAWATAPNSTSLYVIEGVALSFTANDSSSGNSNIIAAEYFIDPVGIPAPGSGTPVPVSSPAPVKTLNATIPSVLSAGAHVISVRSKDALNNWGALASTNLVIDNVGPTTSGLSAMSNPNNGAIPLSSSVQAVRLTASFSDTATGGSNITSAEGFIDTVGANGTGFVFIANDGNFNSPSESGFADLPLAMVNALSSGDHVIHIHAKDSSGNWGTTSTITLVMRTVYFSTVGGTNPPGAGGTPDDADIYYWSGSAFSRATDVTTIVNPLPTNANVDGYDRVDATHYYMSFNGNVTVPGLGTVPDEDIVYYNGTSWTLAFDGSAFGLTTGNFDLDAISIVGGTGGTITAGNLYFSTDNGNVPVGAGGSGDDADIYRWNGGNSYTRVVDANGGGSLGLPSGANVDGFVRVDATRFYMSFSGDTNVPGLGTVQDEDIVYYSNGTWYVYFDGTSKGLTSTNLDVDAFDFSYNPNP